MRCDHSRTGPLDKTLRTLKPLTSTLESLTLSGNKLNGMITDDDIVAFTKLTSLDLGELDLAGELVQAVQHYEL